MMLSKLRLTLLLLCTALTIKGQEALLSGIVTDKNKESLIGVNVVQKGTTKGTVTNYDGEFSFDADPNSTIVFSYIGFVEQEVVWDGSSVLNITLQEDSELLDEVVVIGYGSTRKDDLSMAVSTVKIDANMKSRTSNFSTMMQGAIPGLTIQANGGDPLASASLTIRGKGSRENDKVLFVVDGVPGAPFNMEDVE
ncbi:MAG: carboxypeptidase-like regulatory domain-containing protein [Fermentimonas sp.]|nr:carboxypeptidase-like regulatory domain-containing protein [Fermentimonas sp.]